VANGDLFEPNWWQTLLAGIGTTLLAWAGAHRLGTQHGIKLAIDDDYAKTSISVEAGRAETRAMLEKICEEHGEQLALLREEGRLTRGAIHSIASSISRELAALHRDMIDRTGAR
jgi:hypothetical protein